MKFSEGFIRYFSNTFWLVAERIWAIILTLIVGVYLARYLGPEQYGILNYAISFVGLFSMLATLGLDQIAVRELVADPENRGRILSTIFWLKLAGAVVVFGVIGMTLHFSSSDPRSVQVVLIVATGLVFQAFNVIDFFFQSRVESKFSALAQMMQVSICSLARVVLILLEAPLAWFAVLVALESVILAFGLWFFFCIKKGFQFPYFEFNRKFACNLLKEAWPLVLSGVVVSIYMKIDQVMIKEMIGPEALGLYAVAVRLSEPWYFIPVIALKSLFPAIISLRKGDKKNYEIKLQQLYDLLSLIGFVTALSIFLVSDHVIELLYGQPYSGAGVLLSVHIWSCVLVFPGNIRAHLIILEKRQMAALVFRAIGAGLNVGLNYILIPRMGALGAAWATLASFLFPVIGVALFDSVIRQTVVMTFKSYCLPLRLLIYRTSIYKDNG